MAATSSRKSRVERALRPLPAEVLNAARRTIQVRGVRRTSMGDVAEAARIPRSTLYEYLASREDLIDLVLVARLREIAEQVRSVADGAGSFEEAVVETSVAAVLTTRNDPEVANITATAPNRQVHEILEGRNDAVAEITEHFLEPMLEHGRRSGELRADVDTRQIVAWIRTVYSALMVREDADEDEVRSLVRTFLMPSLKGSGEAPPLGGPRI
ncbi:MAG: TetR/AcrR family transcriptional regulator [Solirubrobacteraceae bacterium]